VGPRAGLDSEARGNILCPRRGSNLYRPVIQSVVRHYTDTTAVTLQNFGKFSLRLAFDISLVACVLQFHIILKCVFLYINIIISPLIVHLFTLKLGLMCIL
jgi:hypothetical protein